VEGVINPFTARYVTRELAAAAEADAVAVVVRRDTPGGLDGSMREITRAMLGSPVPVVVYVAPPGRWRARVVPNRFPIFSDPRRPADSAAPLSDTSAWTKRPPWAATGRGRADPGTLRRGRQLRRGTTPAVRTTRRRRACRPRRHASPGVLDTPSSSAVASTRSACRCCPGTLSGPSANLKATFTGARGWGQ
jgi:hypothetical protein